MSLLQVVRNAPEVLTKKNATPLILEFTVDAATAPYLVSSSKGLMWIEEPHPGSTEPIIKAAVRKNVTLSASFWGASKAIFAMAKERQWGSAQPYTEAGLRAAMDHVGSYGLGAVEILVSPSLEGTVRPQWLIERNLIGENLRVEAWIPDNCAIVVPVDREYLGMLVRLSPSATAMAIHNSSRGFAMCWDGTPDAETVQAKEAKPDRPRLTTRQIDMLKKVGEGQIGHPLPRDSSGTANTLHDLLKKDCVDLTTSPFSLTERGKVEYQKRFG